MSINTTAAEPVSGPTPSAPLLAPARQRLLSLDVLRGLTIAGMILVNNPGSWSTIYPPLEHARWDGWTPTDFVFPFFLFMVGVAMTLSFDRRIERGASRLRLLGHVLARSIVLVLLGWILSGFPNFRLITPFILMVAGLQLVTRDPDPRTPKWFYIGWGSLAAGLAWWLIDFRYFNGPTQRGAFSDFFPLHPGGKSPLRIPGVLQRIGLCYLLASIIALNTRAVGRGIWTVILLVGYWAIMKFVHAPDWYVMGYAATGTHADALPSSPFPGTLNDWIDYRLFGEHLYNSRPDPEGLLSTLPAIGTVLVGTLTGQLILRRNDTIAAKLLGLVLTGVALLILGLCLDPIFPINKKIWSSSYVLFTGGLACVLLAALYGLCDVLNWRRWAVPFAILGTNAIVAFFGSGLVARLLGMIKWTSDGKDMTLRGWLYQGYQSAFSNPFHASLAWALSYVALWILLLWPLYHKRIFVRV